MTTEQQGSGAGQHKGLFGSLKTLAATLLSIASTRLDLLSNELEEERLRLSSIILWTLIALFCAAMGALMVTAIFLVLLWDTYRLSALIISALVFLLGASLSWRAVIVKARAKPRLFSSSLAELSKDREQLTGRR